MLLLFYVDVVVVIFGLLYTILPEKCTPQLEMCTYEWLGFACHWHFHMTMRVSEKTFSATNVAPYYTYILHIFVTKVFGPAILKTFGDQQQQLEKQTNKILFFLIDEWWQHTFCSQPIVLYKKFSWGLLDSFFG